MLTAVTAELNRFAQNHQSQLLLVFAIRVFDIFHLFHLPELYYARLCSCESCDEGVSV